MLNPILFLYFIIFTSSALPLAQLASTSKVLAQFGDKIEKDERVAKYEFQSVLSEAGPFGNVYLASIKGDSSKSIIIKVANPADVIISNEYEAYNPCWSYDEQKNIGSKSSFVLEPIENIPISFEKEKTYFCLVVMERALAVLDQPLFSDKTPEFIVKNTKALTKFILQTIEGVKDIHTSQFINNDLKLSNILLVNESSKDPVISDVELLTAQESKEIPYKAVINDFDVIANLKLDVKLENHEEIMTKIKNNYGQLKKIIQELMSCNQEFIDSKHIMNRLEWIIENNIDEENVFFNNEIKNQPKSRRRLLMHRKQTYI